MIAGALEIARKLFKQEVSKTKNRMECILEFPSVHELSIEVLKAHEKKSDNELKMEGLPIAVSYDIKNQVDNVGKLPFETIMLPDKTSKSIEVCTEVAAPRVFLWVANLQSGKRARALKGGQQGRRG